MSAWLPGLLDWVHTYGYFAIWIALFVAALGLPLPVNLVLLAAGALSAGGHFNIWLLALVASTGLMCGDQVGYGIGRWWGRHLLHWLEQSPRWRLLIEKIIVPAKVYFDRRGARAIFLSRFIVSSLGGEINLLAGADAFPYRRFLLADAAGEILGAVIPLGLGYVSGAKWGMVGNEFEAVSLVVLAAVILLVLTVSLRRIIVYIEHPHAHPPAAQTSTPPDQENSPFSARGDPAPRQQPARAPLHTKPPEA